MLRVGLTPLDTSGRWMGGRYYLQHLVRCISALDAGDLIQLVDVYWEKLPDSDVFSEVRPLISDQQVIWFPRTRLGRLARRASRVLQGIPDARDLFRGIDVTFPLPLIATQGVPYVFWLPDFQHEHLRPLYKAEHYEQIVTQYTRYVERAARIVVSSDFGRRDFARFYPGHVDLVDVVHFCSVPDEQWWAIDARTFCSSIGLDGPFFVLSNQFTEHKNHLVVIEAARILRDRGTPVVIACTGSDYDFRGMDYFGRVQEHVRAHDLGKYVRFLGLLPRAQQIAVTRGAVAALQPSRFEGWSTIIEDAKALGKYVIASEFPVHREQLEGVAATFADPSDAEAWAEALKKVGESRTAGPHLAEEEDAKSRLHAAMRECGASFLTAMRRATAS